MSYLAARNIVTESETAAFGCSHTWGVGVDPSEAWPYLLNSKNFGVGGCSADYIVRFAPEIITANKIKMVYVLWPDWTRFDYTHNGNYYTSLPTDKNRIYFMKNHNNEWLLNNFNEQVQKFHIWCNKNMIKIIDMTLYDLIPYLDHADTWPLSKLGHHYAPEWHVKVADIFKNTLDGSITHKMRHE
jgi:hypothetical protein